jgi:hypothetical protein
MFPYSDKLWFQESSMTTMYKSGLVKWLPVESVCRDRKCEISYSSTGTLLTFTRISNTPQTMDNVQNNSTAMNKPLVYTFRAPLQTQYSPPPQQGTTAPSGPGPPHYQGFIITLRHTTLGRTPLDEWSAQCKDIYLTTHNTLKRQTYMPLAGFKPTIPASKQPQRFSIAATISVNWTVVNLL